MKMVALNAKLKKNNKIVALNAYENDGGSERLWKWWLWTPMQMVALNAYASGGGSERQTEK